MGYTGLGSVLLQHLVPRCFLLYISIFTHCLLNDLAEEQHLTLEKTTFMFSFNISLSESNLRKKPASTDQCMPLPWTPHQGPDKSWANNNLWVKALRRSNAAYCLSDVLQCAHNQYFFSNPDSKVAGCLMKMFLCSVLEQNLEKKIKNIKA